jgi:hypothetical protein
MYKLLKMDATRIAAAVCCKDLNGLGAVIIAGLPI